MLWNTYTQLKVEEGKNYEYTWKSHKYYY
jgi:hypothetical protein